MSFNRSVVVYVLLLAIWVGVIAWQIAEHRRIEKDVRASIINRSADIAYATVLVIRSQSRFNVIGQRRLEAALQELVSPPGGVLGVALRPVLVERIVFRDLGTPAAPVLAAVTLER